MKKTYIKPELNIQVLQSTGMLALSALSETADSTNALVRHNNDWDIWGNDNYDEDWEDDY